MANEKLPFFLEEIDDPTTQILIDLDDYTQANQENNIITFTRKDDLNDEVYIFHDYAAATRNFMALLHKKAWPNITARITKKY